MNFFALDLCPKLAAQAHADQHVHRMLLEGVQILSTACFLMTGKSPWKPTHVNRKCVQWATLSAENWRWLTSLCVYLEIERDYRFQSSAHDASRILLDYLPEDRVEGRFLGTGLSKFPQDFRVEYRLSDAVEGHRNYYRSTKLELRGKSTWTRRPQPSWL